MTTRLWLIRHGPTHAKGVTGWTDVDVDLSDTARIEQLRRVLPDAPMISSDLRRAVLTADAVQQTRPRLAHDADLRETNFGAWEGMDFAEISARDGDLARQFWTEPGDVAPPKGESWNTMATRVSHALDRAITSQTADDLIVVAHFGVILAIVQMATSMSAKSVLSFQIDNLSLTRIDALPDHQFRVHSVNNNG